MKYLRPIRSEDGPSRAAKSDEPSSLFETGTRFDFDLVGVVNPKVGVVAQIFRARIHSNPPLQNPGYRPGVHDANWRLLPIIG